MVIIEGPDCSGKTTISEMLASAFNVPMIHSPGVVHTPDQLDERLFWCDELCKIQRLIMDRCFYFSELVYGPILRGESKIDLSVTEEFLTNKFVKQKHLLVYCDQRLPLNDKKDIELNIELIRGGYSNLFYEMLHPVLQANHSNLTTVQSEKDYPLLLSYARSVL